MNKIGLVDEGKYKAFYDHKGKIMWKIYGINKDKYMRAATGNVNWAGKMKYLYVLATWFFSIFMTCLWIWIICIIFKIK